MARQTKAVPSGLGILLGFAGVVPPSQHSLPSDVVRKVSMGRNPHKKTTTAIPQQPPRKRILAKKLKKKRNPIPVPPLVVKVAFAPTGSFFLDNERRKIYHDPSRGAFGYYYVEDDNQGGLCPVYTIPREEI